MPWITRCRCAPGLEGNGQIGFESRPRNYFCYNSLPSRLPSGRIWLFRECGGERSTVRLRAAQIHPERPAGAASPARDWSTTGLSHQRKSIIISISLGRTSLAPVQGEVFALSCALSRHQGHPSPQCAARSWISAHQRCAVFPALSRRSVGRFG
jgi:hypothetical protein